jgi:DNA-binding transcriptional regulator PaaX
MQRGQLLYRILYTINNAAVAFLRHPSRDPRNVYRIAREFRELQDISDRELRQMIRYSLERKYLRISGGKKRVVYVGGEGKAYLARRMLAMKQSSRWDGKWRIVLFDVPDEQKSARDAFATGLKRAGFVRLQKSVFISPYPCEEELRAYAEYLGLLENVDIALVERITREEDFKEQFGLES